VDTKDTKKSHEGHEEKRDDRRESSFLELGVLLFILSALLRALRAFVAVF